MRQTILILFIIFTGYALYAQEISEADSLSEKAVINVQITPYAQWNKVFGRFMAYAGADAELIYHERVVFGFFSEVMLGTFIKRTVFPSIYEFSNYKYGLTAGYNFPINAKFNLLSRVKVSQQYMEWTEQEGEHYSLSDKCIEIRSLAGFHYFPLKKLALGGSIGYNIADGLDLSGIDQKDMNGLILALSIGIKL